MPTRPTQRRNISPTAVLLALLSALAVLAAKQHSGPTMHVVRLTGNRFEPALVRAAPGDTVRFVNGQGGPHNVEFIADSTTVAARRILSGALTGRIAPLSGPMLIVADEVYDVVVPDLPNGRYPFLCSPHWANMRGALIVAR